jgi:hypothetical protein
MLVPVEAVGGSGCMRVWYRKHGWQQRDRSMHVTPVDEVADVNKTPELACFN